MSISRKLIIGAKLLAKPWFNPLRPYDSILDEAIRRAEAKIHTITCNCEPHGAGDAIVMAWVAEGSKGLKPELKLYATGWRKELLEAFGQEVVPSPAGAKDTFKAYTEEVKGKGCGSRVLQRGGYLGIHSAPKRPPYILKESDDRLARVTEGGLLLFPCTADGAREWPPFYWIELYERLDEAGLQPHIVTPVHDTRYMELKRCHYDYRWPEIMAACFKSRAVITNDSGPMHIAGTLDVLTFALLGPTASEAIYNHMPSVVGLSATKEQIDCVGCYYGRPYGPPCKAGCAALSNLLPETVFQEITKRVPACR